MDKALRFYEAVKWAEKNGITGGIGSGLFGPNNDCTCTQIVTLIPPGKMDDKERARTDSVRALSVLLFVYVRPARRIP